MRWSFLYVFTLWCLVAGTFAAFEQRDLEIRMDEPADQKGNAPERGKRRFMYGSKLTFPQPVMAALDGKTQDDKMKQLAGIVRDAYFQMSKIQSFWDVKPQNRRWRRPYVMTGLAIEGELWLASSVKGGSLVLAAGNEKNAMAQALIQCQLAWNNMPSNGDNKDASKVKHANNGNCGEMVTGYQFFQAHPDWKDLKGGVWVSVENPDQDNLSYEKIRVKEPCGPGKKKPAPSGSDGPSARGPDDPFGCAQVAELKGVDTYSGVDSEEAGDSFLQFRVPDSVVISHEHILCENSPQK